MIRTTTTTYKIPLTELEEIVADWLGIEHAKSDLIFEFVDSIGDVLDVDHVIITEKN